MASQGPNNTLNEENIESVPKLDSNQNLYEPNINQREVVDVSQLESVSWQEAPSMMPQFPMPDTLMLTGDGSDGATWVDLPIPTRLESYQMGEYNATDDFLIWDGTFMLVMGYVGQMRITLSAEGYATQVFMFTAVEPPIEPAEEV